MQNWHPYLVAVVVGLLVGIEREKAHPTKKAMGVRTFLLISLLGAIAGGIGVIWLSILLTFFSLGLIALSYFREMGLRNVGANDRGLTTEFAAGIVYCLGYAAHTTPALSAVIGPVVALILFSKPSLHRFTSALRPSEIEAALLLLLGAVLVINMVPDEPLDRWGIFNPRKFGYLILALATLEFISYVVAKAIGEKRGALLVGLIGGLVSSTAVLLSSARQSRQGSGGWRTQSLAAIAGTVSSVAEAVLIVGLIAPSLIIVTSAIAGVSIVVAVASALILVRYEKDGLKKTEGKGSKLNLRSPLDWLGVLRLSTLMGLILALISVAKFQIGDSATYLVSFLAGLFELHGVTLATATVFSLGKTVADVAALNFSLALVASLTSKIAISWIFGSRHFASAVTSVFSLMIAAAAALSWALLL